ncbi:MAG: hypothetical protein AMXMBFR84_10490 [Candidatus Hydrogenedentota bacterium]
MKWMGLCFIALAVFCGGANAQVTGTIIEQPQDKRLPIAVPDFASAPGQESMGVQMAQIIRDDLAFTGVFRVMSRDQYPPAFTGFTQEPDQVSFDAWRQTKAAFLVHGYVATENGQLAVYCRLFDVASGRQMMGKRLAESPQWARQIAHAFSDEVTAQLDGQPGCATSQLCFSSVVSGKKELFLCDYDGANARQVTQHASISILPAFSPDGNQVAYSSFKDRFPFLYILDLSSGKSRSLSRDPGLNGSPTWAPDGRSLAIVLSKDANMEIYRLSADGSNKQRLTNDPGLDTSPTFSPDGSKIAFVSERGGSPQIYVMSASGGAAQRISTQGGNSVDPNWSPDGRSIVYVVEKGGEGQEVYVMGSDGSNPIRLTNSAGNNESPNWSADSRHVVFTSTRSGRSELWTATLSTGENRKVPQLTINGQGPSWGPRR